MRFRFYLKYLGRVFIQERSLTITTILSVAVGVSVIGAVLTLGKGVEAGLTQDVHAVVGGDVVATSRKGPFTQEHLAKLARLKKQGVIRDFMGEATFTDQAANKGTGALAGFWFIDERRYPLYGPTLRSKEPRGADVRKLLASGVVVSEQIAEKLKVKLGGRIRLGSEAKRYKVAGIIGDEVQPSIDMRVTGFVVRPLSQIKRAVKYTLEHPDTAAKTIYIKTNKAEDAKRIQKIIEKLSPKYSSVERAEISGETLKSTTDMVKKGDAAFGFLSLLIAGIGVGYASRLWAGRRIKDIAILKALGLKAREVKLLFLLALGTLAVIGAFLGLLLSVTLVLALREFARRFIGIPGTFYWFYPKELGLAAGAAFLVITAFSLWSVISLSRTLPAASLRTEEGRFASIGKLRQLGIALVATAMLIAAATMVVGDPTIAAAVTVGALALGAVILTALRLLFFLLPAHLPLGPVFKLAAGSLKSRAWMAARTVLIVMVGIAALGLVLILSENIKSSLTVEMKKQAGYDAIVINPPSAKVAAGPVIGRLPGGFKRLIKGRIAQIELISINHDKKALANKLERNVGALGGGADPYVFDFIKTTTVIDPASGGLPQKIVKGRGLHAGDVGKKVAVVSGRLFKSLKLKLGDTLEIKTGAKVRSLKLVGVTEYSMISVSDHITAPQGSLPGGKQAAASYYLDFKTDKAADIKWLRRRLPDAVVLDVAGLSGAFVDIIDNLRVFPLLVAALALFASVVIVWSSVGLTVMQRRRELAILKSLGAPSKRILWMLALEHIGLGFAGGALAVVVVGLLTGMATEAMFKAPARLNFLPVALVVAIAMGLTAAAGLLPSIRAARARPLEVLRSE